MTVTRPAAALLAATLLCPLRAAAQTPDSTDARSAFELREIVVSASRPVSEAAATVRVLDGARLRAAGARTLDQALALVAGVGVRTGSEGVARVDFRGFRPRQILVLLDGVPLNSTWDGQPDLSLIPVDRVAYVKVTGGTASVLYGEALGAVIEVVTREGVPGTHGEAAAETRTGPAHGGRAALSSGTGSWRFFGAASGSAADAFPARGADGAPLLERANSARDWSSAFGSATLSGRRGRVGLLLSAGRGSWGLPPSTILSTTDPFATRPVFERVEREANGSAQLSGAWAAGPGVSLRGWSFLNAEDQRSARYDDSTYAGMQDTLVKGTYRQDATVRLAGAGAHLAWTMSRSSRATVALSGERDSWSVEGVIRDVALAPNGGGTGGGGGKGGGTGGTTQRWGVRPLTGSRALGRAGIAAEWELTPTPALGLSLGAARHVLLRDSAADDGAGALSAGIRWTAPAGVELRASAAHKFRFPSIRQLYDADGGNPALTPEHADEVELGASRALAEGLLLRLAAFRADVRGYIDRPAPGEPFANRGLLRFQGAEATLAASAGERLQVDGSLALLRTQDRTPGGDGRELQYTPRLRAGVDARWRPARGLLAAVSASRVAHQVYYSRQLPLQSGRLPDYTLLGARLAWRPGAGRAGIYAGGENLLDAAYQDQYGFPRPARTLYGGLELSW